MKKTCDTKSRNDPKMEKLKQKRNDIEKKINLERAYYIYKQDEEIEKMNKKWWGHLKQLE